jgi:DNA-binding IclR family transcriptional regulator
MSVGRALAVRVGFALDAELGVSDIARRLGVAKSTAHRLLQTLATRGFVEQHPRTGLYRLGMHVFELGQLAHRRNELRHVALPALRQLADATGLTVTLGVADGPDVVFVERIESPDGVRLLRHSGHRLPAHCTSTGKALAAYDPGLDRARRRAGFSPRQHRTIRSEADWDRALAEVRRLGYAQSHGESFDGASSVGVPVIVRGVAAASVSLLGPTAMVEPRVDRLVPPVLAATRRIGRSYRG